MDGTEQQSNITDGLRGLLPDDKLSSLLKTFRQIDRNQDDRIEIDEFLDFALTEYKIKLTRFFECADADKDGCIEFEEYVAVKEPNYQLLKKFQEFDIEKNGLLSVDEAIDIARSLDLPLGSESVRSVFQKADQDGDGQITYYEYLGAIAHVGFQ